MEADRSEALPTARRPHRLAGGQPGLLEPGASTDPYRLRLYRILRTDFPLGYDPGLGAWLLSRYADVALALTDPRFTGYPRDGAPRGPVPAPLGLCRGSLVCTPLPGSGTDRIPGSTPATASAVERAAYVLARRIAGRDQADLVGEFCRWLPAGLSSPRLKALVRTGGGAADCARHTGLRERALASFLANMLDDPDLLAAVAGGVGPGAEAGTGMLLDRAWTETLRRDPPVQIVLRRTRTEVRVSGGTLPAGAPVACLIGAAGRDPARFAAPDRFDPLRADADPLLTGPAGCPAALLGRLEAEHGLRALLTAMPGIRWADGFRPASSGVLTRGPRTLLVRPS
ncbi:cytochrome P450 [Streptomyces cyaneofuscatus]|uniref:Cytochrome P450 n=1 Tax=Streptomyces cyaneofuscatus TaxID=66883 RepID=A0ABZ1F3W6_9ACTN|nr:cytochrome P450 [Streptomyces cyaneofuscatus]WSB11118.1 cytochrome P450 [Streptomyces cyaneofuscatus]WSD45349.1 cytochrome P450 [Streptomyces cyaneofuscatus]